MENKSKIEGRKLFQYLCSITVSLGAFTFGCSMAWTSPGLKFLMKTQYESPLLVENIDESDWIAALSPLSAILGAVPAGYIADHWGRRWSLIVFTALQVASNVCITYASHVMLMYAARLVMGIVMGVYCAVIPMYIVEIAEDSVRGTLGSLFELFVTIGILYTYILGIFDSYDILCHGITAITVILLIGLLFIPETPTYLILVNKQDEAEKSLRKFRGSDYDTTAELNERRAQLQNAQEQKFSWDVLKRRENVKGLSISIFLMIFQQFTGATAVVSFGDIIFEHAGFWSPTLGTIVTGTTQAFGVLIAGVLVDRLGRKILLYISSIIMTVCHVGLGYYFWSGDANPNVAWMPLLFLFTFMLGYSIGWGPLAWVMFAELLGPDIKKFGFSVTVAVELFCVFLVTFTFQPLIHFVTAGVTFWIFAVASAFATVFVAFFVPETKSRSLKQIQDQLAGRSSLSSTNKIYNVYL